jgi:UDPglucose 6-dehydrogenase
VRIGVIGTGHVGLVVAACLAHVGHDVMGMDDDAQKVRMLSQGEMPIYEPALAAMVQPSRAAGRLGFTTDLRAAIHDRQVAFICVSTPVLPDGRADLAAVEEVARRIAAADPRDLLIVERSTGPASTAAWIERTLAIYGGPRARGAEVASNPEFLRMGSAVHDCLHPDRLVVGVKSARAAQRLRDLYAPIMEGKFVCPFHEPCLPATPPPFVTTSFQGAELIKHASNAFLAMKISFINAVADFCERVGADVTQVTQGVGLDPRIGRAYLQAGLGFGGSCFPNDTLAFLSMAEEMGVDIGLVREAHKINRRRIQVAVEKLRRALWTLRGKRIGLLGLAFKPHTDDVRESPALALAARLLQEGVQVVAHDPKAGPKALALEPSLSLADDPYALAEGAEALVLVTEWPEFLALDWGRLRQAMRRAVILDGRNALDQEKLVAEGFEYLGMGR